LKKVAPNSNWLWRAAKALYDKREVQKKRSWERERGRLMRQKS